MSYLSQEILALKQALLAKFLWYDTQCAHIGIVLTTAAPKYISVVNSKWLPCSCMCWIIYDEDCFLEIFVVFYRCASVHLNSSCQIKSLYLRNNLLLPFSRPHHRHWVFLIQYYYSFYTFLYFFCYLIMAVSQGTVHGSTILVSLLL